MAANPAIGSSTSQRGQVLDPIVLIPTLMSHGVAAACNFLHGVLAYSPPGHGPAAAHISLWLSSCARIAEGATLLLAAARLALPALRLVNLKQSEAPLWPLSEAAAAAFHVGEVPAGKRVMPQPAEPDLNTILPLILSSLFADVEAKAPFWQRPRPLPPARSPIASSRSQNDAASDTASMVQAFKLGYGNLLEIWSLVLPPNTLLGLKRLSQLEAAEFTLPHNLWARIVYDFLMAWRLRTLNRSHLLGAMIPLYLAWVASHIHNTLSGSTAEQHVEAVAGAFESEKPYLVARWRWPDRFNP